MSEALNTLRRSALILVIVGLAWNLLEAAIAFWATLQSSSVALLAFRLTASSNLQQVASYFGTRRKLNVYKPTY